MTSRVSKKNSSSKGSSADNVETKDSAYRKPHVIIPQEDMRWVRNQKPSVKTLWEDCWLSDPYGSRWMPLSTELTGKTLKQAKALLRKQGLFDFKTTMQMLEGKRYYETLVINLHGSRRREYWGGVVEDPTSPPEITLDGEDDDPKQSNDTPDIGGIITPGGVQNYPTNVSQTQVQQEFQNASRTFHEHLTNSSEEIVRCSVSSTPTSATSSEGGLSASTVEVGFDLNAWKSQLLANKGKRKPKIATVEDEQARIAALQYSYELKEKGLVDILPVPE